MVDFTTVSDVVRVLDCLDEPEDGVAYEYRSSDDALYVKLSRVGGRHLGRLHVGVATSGNHKGDIIPNPVKHASNVGQTEAAKELERLLEALAARDDVKEVRANEFSLERVHDDYHDVRRVYSEVKLREPFER